MEVAPENAFTNFEFHFFIAKKRKICQEEGKVK